MSPAEQAADELRDKVWALTKAECASDVVCPRERTFMTPCIARDGHTALDDPRPVSTCVGCGSFPDRLLAEHYGRHPKERVQ